MKNKISSFNSYRKKVVRKTGLDSISPSTRHGETLIPAGSETATVELPATKETFTYEIVNSDSMSGDIKVVATGGTLKGLLLNNTNGSLSIMKIPAGSKQIEFGSEMKDGSYANTISDGDDWFFWGVGVGNGLATSTVTYDRNSPDGNGESSGGDLNSTEQEQQFAPILITDLTTTADYPSGPAENDLQFRGTAEPLSTLNVYNESDTLIDTVSVGSDGRWTWIIEDLANGEHTFKFKSFVDGSQVAETLSWTDTIDGASVTFECPEIQIEVGTSGPNFITFPTITNPLGGTITPTVNSTTYLSTMAEGDTFTVTFDYSYETNSYQQTVNGVVVNLVQPSVPEITTVGGNTSGVAINTTIVDIEGTASPNARVDVWRDGTPNTLIATVTADGNGDWIISSHDFGFNTNSSCIVRAQQQTYRGSRWSESSQDFTVVYEQNVLDAPTIVVDGLSNNSHTNQENPINISGTGVVGAEITLNGATPLSSPVIVDSNGDWSVTINLSGDAAHTLTAQASKAGFTTSQPSVSFRVNVDRTPPYFTDAIEDTTSYLGQSLDTLPSAADAFSTATVTAAYVPALTNAEGTYVATYTATDLAGNTATDTRTIIVTTATIIPTNLVVVDNGDGTFTVTGDVDGEYADNLTVQIIIGGTLDGTAPVIGGQFSYTSTILPEGEYTIGVNTTNSAGETPSESEETTETVTNPNPNTPPTLTVYREISSDGLEDDGALVTFGDATVSNGELVLDGAGDYAELADNNDWDLGGLDTTIDFWFYANELPDGNEGAGGQRFGLVSKSGNNVINGWTIALDNDPSNTPGLTDGQMQVTLNNGGNQHVRSRPPNGVSIDEWHHFAVVLPAAGNGDAIMYFDGEELSSFTITQRPNGNSDPLRFGAYKVQNSIQQFFPGKLDGVTITKSILTPAQILEKYQTGRSVEITNGDTVSITNGTNFNYYSIATDAEDGSLVASATETPSLDTSTNGTYSIQHSVTDSGGLTATHSFDVNVLANYLERSATLYGDAAIANCTLNLDGTGDFGTVSDGFRHTDLLSVSVWFKTSASGDNRIVSSHIRNASPVKNGWLIYLDNGQLKFFEPSFTNGTNVYTGGTGGKNDNQWHHVVLTWDKTSTWHFYIDGTQVRQGNSNPSHVVSYVSGWDLYIGANGWNNNNPPHYGYFNGEITKVEVLNEVLSPTDVVDRYNVGPETC